MAAPDLVDLMQQYARQGIHDWRSTPSPMRQRAEHCLGPKIAQNIAEASVTIHTIYNNQNDDQLRFIPVPKHPNNSGIYPSFFLPIRRIVEGGAEIATFELFVVVRNTDSLAFRIESAHPLPSAHNYGHVQMSRKMLQGKFAPRGVPEWLPDRYPAFFSPMPNPLQTFLGMAVALHGYSGGAEAVIQAIFQTAGRTRDAAVYLELLKRMLT